MESTKLQPDHQAYTVPNSVREAEASQTNTTSHPSAPTHLPKEKAQPLGRQFTNRVELLHYRDTLLSYLILLTANNGDNDNKNTTHFLIFACIMKLFFKGCL